MCLGKNTNMAIQWAITKLTSVLALPSMKSKTYTERLVTLKCPQVQASCIYLKRIWIFKLLNYTVLWWRCAHPARVSSLLMQWAIKRLTGPQNGTPLVHSTHCRFNLNVHVLFSLRMMVPKLLVPCGHLNINNSVSHSFWDIKAITINNKDHSWVEQQPLLASVHHNTLSMQHYVLKWRRGQDGWYQSSLLLSQLIEVFIKCER